MPTSPTIIHWHEVKDVISKHQLDFPLREHYPVDVVAALDEQWRMMALLTVQDIFEKMLQRKMTQTRAIKLFKKLAGDWSNGSI